jgi:hypothetical protein
MSPVAAPPPGRTKRSPSFVNRKSLGAPAIAEAMTIEDLMGSAWKPRTAPTPPPRKSVQEKIEEVKVDIADLDYLRKKLRISTTMAGIAIRRMYSRQIAKAAEERKSVSMSYWHGKRTFEEDFADLHRDLVYDYGTLARGETERDRLRREVGDLKKETAKLEHWRDLQAMAYDRMEKEERGLLQFGETDITRLLVRLTDAHTELDILTAETDQLEETINIGIREPMVEMDEVRRRIQRVQIDSCEIRRHSSRAPRPSQSLEIIEETLVSSRILRTANAELRRNIRELEEQIIEMKPAQQEMMKTLGNVEFPVLRTRSEKRVFIPEIPLRPAFTSGILPRNPYLEAYGLKTYTVIGEVGPHC